MRRPSQYGWTLGHLSIDGVFECYTCEDVIRPPGVKVVGLTAIPPGRFAIRITKSQRFGVMLPLLLNVPMFEGIRIHAGNTDHDTDGCILVGTAYNRRGVLNSRVALAALLSKLARAQARGEAVWITVESPASQESRDGSVLVAVSSPSPEAPGSPGAAPVGGGAGQRLDT